MKTLHEERYAALIEVHGIFPNGQTALGPGDESGIVMIAKGLSRLNLTLQGCDASNRVTLRRRKRLSPTSAWPASMSEWEDVQTYAADSLPNRPGAIIVHETVAHELWKLVAEEVEPGRRVHYSLQAG